MRKKQSRRYLQLDDDLLPFGYIVMSSCAAGALASWLTSPLDMAKLRLQVQRGQVATVASTSAGATASTETAILHRGIWDCLRYSYQHQGGVRGLFRGAGARVLHFAPATTVTMTCYESCRHFLHNAIYA
jgi:hypothetical protein